MTISSILKKILKYSWIIVIFAVLGAGYGFNQSTKTEYYGSVNLSLPLSNTGDSQTDQTNGQITPKLSTFLVSKLGSLYFQQKVAAALLIPFDQLSEKKPFYTVTDIGLGFAAATYQGTSIETAIKFNNTIKELYKTEIVEAWNDQRPVSLQIKAISDIKSSTWESKKSTQTTVIPFILCTFVGLCVVLVIPEKK